MQQFTSCFMILQKKSLQSHIINPLTHWGRVTHICVSKFINIHSDNGRRQAIIWASAGILLIGSLGTNFSEMVIEIYIFSFKKMHLKMLSVKVAAILSRGRWVKCWTVLKKYMLCTCIYRQTSNISCTLVGYKIVDHSDVVRASPIGAAPTTSSFSN